MKYAQFSDNDIRDVLNSKDPRQTFLQILMEKVQKRAKIVNTQKRKLKEMA